MLSVTGPTGIMSTTDTFAAVNYAGVATVVLPLTSNITVGSMVVVKDVSGAAMSNPILVTPASGSETIDGSSNVTITSDYGSYSLVYALTNKWSVI